MKILGSKQLLPVALFQCIAEISTLIIDYLDPVSEDVFTEWCEMFLDEIEKSLGTDSSVEVTSESELEDEEPREMKKNL